jgi:hypothetical protein
LGLLEVNEISCTPPVFSSMDRIGGCGGPGRYQETKRGKGLALFPEIAEKGAALKLLQPGPLCPDRWESLDSGIGSFLARDRGGSLKRLHRPNGFSVWLPEFEGGGVGIHVRTGLDPGYPQRGLDEASEGIYPGRGQGKTGGWQE